LSYWRLALLALTSGCSATHVVTLPPLESKHPVSASAAYVDRDGATVDAAGYRVVAPFQFTKQDQSGRARAESTLQLGPELDRLVKTAQGDAVTKLRVEATSFGTRQNVATILGVTLGLVGSVLLVQDALSKSENETRLSPVFWTGAACFGAGTVLYFVGDFSKPTRWEFRVSGQVVRALPRPTPPPGEP
jgi:hypothetical protein